MKNKIRLISHTRLLSLFFTFLFLSQFSYSQVIISPSLTEAAIATATQTDQVNCDMVVCPNAGGVQLTAVTWDDLQFIGGNWHSVCSLSVDYTGSTGAINIALPVDASSPDVVIGDDMSNPGTDYLIGVVYQRYIGLTPNIFIDLYSVTGVNTALFAVNYVSTTTFISGSGVFHPHIDMFANNVSQIAGLPSLQEFVATWSESGSATFHAAIGNLATPAGFTLHTITTGSVSFLFQDVAAITDFNSGNRTACFAYSVMNSTSTDLYYAEYDVNTTTLSTPLFLESAQAGAVCPTRIEAMNLYNPMASPLPAKYQIVISLPPLAGGGQEIHSYNDITYVPPTPLNCVNTTLFPSSNGYVSPAVAAGIGQSGSSGNMCNTQYSIGMHVFESTPPAPCPNCNNFYSQTVDLITGSLASIDYYQMNMVALGYSPSFPGGAGADMLGMSSCSNSGYDLLSAWWNGTNIMYKLSGNTYGFKSTSVATSQKKKAVSVYPNPAKEHLSVAGIEEATYSIADAIGRSLLSGTITSSKNEINIRQLTPGMYVINLSEKGEKKNYKFVVE